MNTEQIDVVVAHLQNQRFEEAASLLKSFSKNMAVEDQKEFSGMIEMIRVRPEAVISFLNKFATREEIKKYQTKTPSEVPARNFSNARKSAQMIDDIRMGKTESVIVSLEEMATKFFEKKDTASLRNAELVAGVIYLLRNPQRSEAGIEKLRTLFDDLGGGSNALAQTAVRIVG
jgi:hypothetical protein